MSFYTAIAGALTNVALNLWLIRTLLGAMGAAIATVASYVIVFVLRLISARRLMPFKINFTKLFVSFALLLVQMVSIMSGHALWILVQAVCLCALIALNGVKLLKYAKIILLRRQR